MDHVSARSKSKVVNEIVEINSDCDNMNISSSNAACKANEKVALVRRELEQAIDARKKKKRGMKSTPTKPQIQMVPTVVARNHENNFGKYYEPKWVSIGPIHHGNPRLSLSEDKYKIEFASKFIDDSGHQSSEALRKTIEDKIEELKKCFNKEVIKDYTNEALTWILFVDGCFALQFMRSYVRGELSKLFEIKNDQIAFVQRDLFLLENQIPIEVLKLLMEASMRDGLHEELKDSIEEFVRMNVMSPEEHQKNLEVNMDQTAHLLDLLRLALLQQSSKDLSVEVQQYGQDNYKSNDHGNNVQRRFQLVSADDLVAGGIHLMPSKTFSLISGVTFSENKLTLPPLIIDDSTACKFLNLIAYEMCPDNFRTRYEVTSYICLMHSLIDYPIDVRVLKSDGILHNFLGSDEKFVQLFDEMATGLVPNTHIYNKVLGQIEMYGKKIFVAYRRTLKKDYFRDPWALVTFLFTIVISLTLSLVQTVFTISPLPGPCDKFCQKKL